ncbi:MAG: CHAT domain-containing protein [Sphingopyxis sp.]
MKNYLNVSVHISSASDNSYEVRVASDQGQGSSTFVAPFALGDIQGAMFGTGASRGFGTGDAKKAAPPPRSVTDLGVELFEALFQGETRDLLSRMEAEARRLPNTGVRIRLSLNLAGANMAEIAALPWEVMTRRNNAPMVISTQTVFVRSLDTPRPIDPRPFTPPLKILVLRSNPAGSGVLNLKRESDALETIWAKLPNVEVDFVEPVKAKILDQLAQEDYHVLHYMGHGDFDSDHGGMLLLENDDGSAHLVSATDFAAWLHDEPLRLVFLNACSTGATPERSGPHPYTGVAAALINNGVPAVVAMQFPISDQAAIDFARTFYVRISQGLPVDAAAAEGRKALYSNEATEWITPVLYLRAGDGNLFSAAAAGPSPAASAQVTPLVPIPVPPAPPKPKVATLMSAPAATEPKTTSEGALAFLSKPVLLAILGTLVTVFGLFLWAVWPSDEPIVTEPAPIAEAAAAVPAASPVETRALDAIDAVTVGQWAQEAGFIDGTAAQIIQNIGIEDIQALAATGDARAQYIEGLYWLGVNQNYDAAPWAQERRDDAERQQAGTVYARFMAQSAAAHFAPAQYQMALIDRFANGDGTQPWSPVARDWLQQAADQGHGPSAEELAGR